MRTIKIALEDSGGVTGRAEYEWTEADESLSLDEVSRQVLLPLFMTADQDARRQLSEKPA